MEKRRDNHLAEGEATGHAHRATAPDAVVYGDGDERTLDAPNGTAIEHEEHAEGTLPPGEYDVCKQLEIDPDTEEARAVKD